MSEIIDYFYFDYLLYENIKHFLQNKEIDFKITRCFSEQLESIDPEIELKLILNKIISMFTTIKCKKYHICCRMEALDKFSSIINLLSKFNIEKLKRLFHFFVKCYLIIGHKKNAFEKGIYRVHKKEFKSRIRKIYFSDEFRRKNDLKICLPSKKSLYKKKSKKTRRRLKKRNYFSVGDYIYSQVILEIVKKEINKIYRTFDLPCLTAFTLEKIKEIRKKKLLSIEKGEKVQWHTNDSFL